VRRGESLWDELLPVDARQRRGDLARLDELLRDRELLRPIERHPQREAEASGRWAKGHGRPTIAMETYVRVMVVKQHTGWGYETVVREVSDSLHLRRFCLIPLGARVPEESTIRKLTRRLGSEVVGELTRALIGKAVRARRFRPRAARGRLDGGRGGRATRRTMGWRCRGRGRWPRRAAGWRGGSGSRGRHYAIARAPSGGGSGRSAARPPGAAAGPRSG
jgi:IS5 family transposase